MALERDRLFIDTWGWLVLEDGKDSAHAAVEDLRRRAVERGCLWVTTDYVLDETITRLFGRRPFAEAQQFIAGVLRAWERGVLVVENVSLERFRKAYALRLRYRDKPRISFTDFTSFVVMKELGIRRVLTADAHFAQAHLGFQVLP